MGTLLNNRKSIKWVPKEVTRREVWFLWDFSCSRISTYFIPIRRTEAVNAVYAMSLVSFNGLLRGNMEHVENLMMSSKCRVVLYIYFKAILFFDTAHVVLAYLHCVGLYYNYVNGLLYCDSHTGHEVLVIYLYWVGLCCIYVKGLLYSDTAHVVLVISLLSRLYYIYVKGLLYCDTAHVVLIISSMCRVVLYVRQRATLLRYGACSPRHIFIV